MQTHCLLNDTAGTNQLCSKAFELRTYLPAPSRVLLQNFVFMPEQEKSAVLTVINCNL